MTTLVTVIRADGSVKFVQRAGRFTAENERSIAASARKQGAEVAGFHLVPDRAVSPQIRTVTSVSDALARPEAMLDAQVFEVHAVLSARVYQSRERMLSARRSRPSYAPQGRETTSEQATAASLAADARSLAIVEAEAIARSLWG